MAGDWIKVEHATASKPEILRAAEMLGIGRRETLGLFFDYWIWLDENLSGSCPDFVRNVSKKSLDEVLHCSGFGELLESIGWAKFGTDGWTLHVVNAERHNGNSAKSRALDASRKRAARQNLSGPRPENVRPREEKRREEITASLRSAVGAAATNAAPVPHPKVKPGLAEPTPQHRQQAQQAGVDCETEWAKYLDWQAAKGVSHKDRSAGFRNWLRNASPRPTTTSGRRADNVAVLTGQRKGEREISGNDYRTAVPALPNDLRQPGDDDVG